jgi:hypothetical protein
MEKINFRQIVRYIPEVLFFSGALSLLVARIIIGPLHNFWSTGGYVYIGLIIVYATLLFWRNKWFSYSISVLTILICFYFILALLSEYHEFPKGDPKGIEMLHVGLLIFLPIMVNAVVMLIKSLINKEKI